MSHCAFLRTNPGRGRRHTAYSPQEAAATPASIGLYRAETVPTAVGPRRGETATLDTGIDLLALPGSQHCLQPLSNAIKHVY
jgi:hypothetical protein